MLENRKRRSMKVYRPLHYRLLYEQSSHRLALKWPISLFSSSVRPRGVPERDLSPVLRKLTSGKPCVFNHLIDLNPPSAGPRSASRIADVFIHPGAAPAGAASSLQSIRKLNLPPFHRLTKKHPPPPLDTVVRLGQKGGKPRPLETLTMTHSALSASLLAIWCVTNRLDSMVYPICTPPAIFSKNPCPPPARHGSQC